MANPDGSQRPHMRVAWEALERNDFRFAERTAREALLRDGTDAEALYLLGSTLLFEGRFKDALGSLGAALGRHAVRGVGYRLGHCYLGLGDFARAEEALRRETQAWPEYANAHNTLGVALVNQGREEEALAAFLAAVRLEEGHGEANNNAGSALRALGREHEALPYLKRAATAQPGVADVHKNLGLVLQGLRRHAEAVESFARTIGLDPQHPYALSQLVWNQLMVCDWRELAPRVAALRAQASAGAVPVVPFTLLAVSDSPAEHLQCATTHVRATFGSAPAPLAPPGTRYGHPRLRVAYLSADFREHVMAQILTPLFEKHNRTRFEVIGVSYGPDDGGPARARLAGAFDRFEDVRALDDDKAARRLREMEIDIAVDLGGHTAAARLGILAPRPAPLQATYLGYPGTTAAPWIDYLLADRVVIPPAEERFYTEKVVCLPGSYLMNDPATAIAPDTPSRAQAGLPGRGFVFCSFNNAYKLTPQVFEVWMRLLAAVPNSVLWLLEPHADAVRNLRAAAQARGIDPVRVVFAPRAPLAEHLARHRLADLFLDTLPYNAHTTASDALWMGVPVLTCRGASFAGRVAAGLLGALDLPELVTTSLAEYEALALKLAREPTTLAALRAKVERNRLAQPFFDSARACARIEEAYRIMWERHQRGETPQAFTVPV